MNPVIKEHFDEIEVYLLLSPAIVSYRVVRRDIGSSDGKFRLRVTLSDGGLVELFEYVTEASGHLDLRKYSFHWQDGQGNLKRRWDNAPHYPHLPNAPHHVHKEDRSVEEMMIVPDIFFVLALYHTHLSTQEQPRPPIAPPP